MAVAIGRSVVITTSPNTQGAFEQAERDAKRILNVREAFSSRLARQIRERRQELNRK